MKRSYWLIILLVLIGSYRIFIHSSPKQYSSQINNFAPTVASGKFVLSARTKTANCLSRGSLQDKNCTPGAIFQDVTITQICTLGYSKSVRSVSVEEKRQVYDEYGIVSHQPGEYEVDHLISLELGGSNDISNLWPEAANPRPGFHEKDMVENYLHQQVCSGQISLQQAQNEIVSDWLLVYNVVHH